MIKISAILLLSVLIKAQTSVTDTTNLILIKFSEQMLISTLVKDNFIVKDSLGNQYKIHRVGVYPDTISVVLETERLPYYRTIEIKAMNVRDKAGNIIADKNKAFIVFFGYNKRDKPSSILFNKQ